MQIVPEVYLINGFPYGWHQNGYLLRTPKATVVIDSCDLENDSFDTVAQACRRWGFYVSRVTHLLVTHERFDHSSHVARLRWMSAHIMASQDTADAMRVGDDRCIGYAVGQQFDTVL